MKATFTVRGIKVRTASARRYVVVVVRPATVTTPNGTYVPFASVYKRSDSLATARDSERKLSGVGLGAFPVVVDTTTGEEI